MTLTPEITAKTAHLRGKTAAVVGIGRSNIPLAEFLIAAGCAVTARDKKERAQLGDAADRLEAMGVTLICGENYLDGITEDYIFRAPAVRFDKPEFTAAVARGSVLTSEMALFLDLCPCPVVGITGSDGKTTTTTVISILLRKTCERRGRGTVYLGGNIGRPLLPDVCAMTADDFAVVELSSFQLHTLRRSPHIAVITNISPNHLDYHTDMAEYIDAKRNILRYQREGDVAVLNAANDVTAAIAAENDTPASVRLFGGSPETCAVCEKVGAVWLNGEKILDTADILLPAHHNVENYMAAIAATAGIVPPDIVRETAKTFPGVEHRLEFVREVRGVRYYNSSIDSSPTRSIAALGAFSQKVIVICGGYDKHIPYDPLAPVLCERAKTVVLTGATGPKIGDALARHAAESGEALPEIRRADAFDEAVAAAADAARPGDVVLLSPASASFDAFRDFEERGRHFKDLVRAMRGDD